MGDHIEKAIAEDMATEGTDAYIDQFMGKFGSRHITGAGANFHGFRNNMKTQLQWHKSRDRLQAKLQAKQQP